MRTADHRDNIRVPRPWTGLYSFGMAAAARGQAKAFRPYAGGTAPEQAARRRADNADNRDAVRDQREIDGEFVASREGFAGAVERVDDQETRMAVEAPIRSCGLFRNDGNAGQ